MRLSELEASFIKHGESKSRTGVEFTEADGIFYLCPRCFINNGNSAVGTHWMETPWNNQSGGPTWKVSGDSIENLTTEPSIQVIGGCEAHYYIRNGGIDFV